MATIAGGCLCGRVRYTATGDPVFSGVCHCKSCQRFTGSAFEAVMAVPSPSVSVQGELKTYDDTGDSGKQVHRKFCPNCGSGVMTEADVMPGLTLLMSGSMDDPSVFQPAMEIYCASAQPWVHGGAERQRFPKMPG
ncbi:MAG: GFA family protein [Acetobacteraceae bacterium]